MTKLREATRTPAEPETGRGNMQLRKDTAVCGPDPSSIEDGKTNKQHQGR